MDQNDTLLISSQAWALSAEPVIEFLGEVLCEKSNHAFSPTLCPCKFLFAKNSVLSSLPSTASLVELAKTHLSHQDIPESGKMLLLPLLLLPPR